MQVFGNIPDLGGNINIIRLPYNIAHEDDIVDQPGFVTNPREPISFYWDLMRRRYMDLRQTPFAYSRIMELMAASAANNMEYYADAMRVLTPLENRAPIPKSDLPTEGALVLIPTRNVTYEMAKREIMEYIQGAGNRKVYISELAEELQIDIDLIKYILKNIQNRA